MRRFVNVPMMSCDPGSCHAPSDGLSCCSKMSGLSHPASNDTLRVLNLGHNHLGKLHVDKLLAAFKVSSGSLTGLDMINEVSNIIAVIHSLSHTFSRSNL